MHWRGMTGTLDTTESHLAPVHSPHHVLKQSYGSLAPLTPGNLHLVRESVQGVGVLTVPPLQLLPGHQGPELVVVLCPALVVDTADQPLPVAPD